MPKMTNLNELQELEKVVEDKDKLIQQTEMEKREIKEQAEKLLGEAFDTGLLLNDTRFSGRYSYGDSLRLHPTQSKSNDHYFEALEVARKAGANRVAFYDGKLVCGVSYYRSDSSISGKKEDVMKFCFEHNIEVTDNERNKEIKELLATIETSEEKLARLREEKKEENKLKRSLSKKMKEEAATTDEWFDGSV